MRALLVYPRFPRTFWSYEKVLALVGRKALMPPLGLVTVAALLPSQWELRLVDLNVRPMGEEDWSWADLVLFSAMIVQKEDLHRQIAEAKRRGKTVVAGGPYPTSLPAEVEAAGADYLVLDEGEITIPMFLRALERGDRDRQRTIVFRSGGEKPDVTATPVPRFDLLDLDAYDTMAVQYSRGCPFLCEFCDIITLYGRRPRTKSPPQLLAELERLRELGWSRGVFLVDDNFIGNKRAAKEFLRALEPWQAERGHPFAFGTEASIDLAADAELLDLMARCGFDAVFIGIETPDRDSLAQIRKHQNNRSPMAEAVRTITRAGLRVQAGFILGFDGESAGAGRRIADFVEETAIPTAMVSMLQALPGTALWQRLEREGRLRDAPGDGNQTTLINFRPTRPADEIAREYVETFWELYDPTRYLDRVHRYFLGFGASRRRRASAKRSAGALRAKALDTLVSAGALLRVVWRQGVVRETRGRFWRHLASMAARNPRVLVYYLIVCAHNEHYLDYRRTIRDELTDCLRGAPPIVAMARDDHVAEAV